MNDKKSKTCENDYVARLQHFCRIAHKNIVKVLESLDKD